MYKVIEILSLLIGILGIIYLFSIKKKYQNDNSTAKEDIIKYFKDNNATTIETGIKRKDLPLDIAKNPYLLLMVQDKTLSFKKGKYFLNNKSI